jgi:hypothetical protein
MRKAIGVLMIVASVATAGCATRRSSGPDEFAVARNAPLVIPPDYTLTPPVAGTGGLSAGDAQQQAIDALFGGPAPRSPAESSLLDDAGRDRAQIGIRSTVWDPDTRVVDKGAATLTIINSPQTDSQIASAQPGQ